jgi:5-methylcytosine-specific restriction endonuclease McrA
MESNKICPLCKPQTIVTNGLSLCKFHRSYEHRHIFTICLQDNKRAQKLGLLGDLTAEQFVIATRYFSTTENGLTYWACAYCGIKCTPGLDHWNPLSLGGATTFTNVLPCCPTCNFMKSAMTGYEFLDYMIRVWKSPTAAMSKTKITLYWQLVERGIEEVYQHAMGLK